MPSPWLCRRSQNWSPGQHWSPWPPSCGVAAPLRRKSRVVGRSTPRSTCHSTSPPRSSSPTIFLHSFFSEESKMTRWVKKFWGPKFDTLSTTWTRLPEPVELFMAVAEFAFVWCRVGCCCIASVICMCCSILSSFCRSCSLVFERKWRNSFCLLDDVAILRCRCRISDWISLRLWAVQYRAVCCCSLAHFPVRCATSTYFRILVKLDCFAWKQRARVMHIATDRWSDARYMRWTCCLLLVDGSDCIQYESAFPLRAFLLSLW